MALHITDEGPGIDIWLHLCYAAHLATEINLYVYVYDSKMRKLLIAVL